MRLQRAARQLSLSGLTMLRCVCCCVKHGCRFCSLSLRERVLSQGEGPQGAMGFGKRCNHGIVCQHAVAQKPCAEKERAYALCQLPP